MIPVEVTEAGLCVYTKPVENFLDRIYERSKHGHTFHDLYKVLTWPRLLSYAAIRILGNKGAYTAGVDGVTKGYFMRTFQQQITEIRKSLKEGYKPGDILRTYIPKKKGKRPLGISILRDRVLQEAIRLILEAIWEPEFSPYSHGYRIRRSREDCLKDTFLYMQPNRKMAYALEGDIVGFFDNISHKILYRLLGRRIHDHKFRVLIWRMMRARIAEGKKLEWWLPWLKTTLPMKGSRSAKV